MHVTLGSRVYYKDNGPADTGTIVDVLLDPYPFVVKWDKASEPITEADLDKFIETDLGELGTIRVPVKEIVETIDQFTGDQLALVAE